MRGRFEFTLHPIAADAAATGEVDSTLALLGAQGWELRALTTLRDGSVLLALQRPLDEDLPLPDASTLSATLIEPLTRAAYVAGARIASARSSCGSCPGSPGCAPAGSSTTTSGVIPTPSMSRPAGVR